MPWDVFVSHNRQDKPWVRIFVQHLRKLGMQVFFDEDSVPPGGEFQREVTEAIKESRTCVFVITAASVLSPWVADEINTAFHYRAASNNQLRIIPVYLDSVRLDHAGLDTAAAIHLTEKNMRDRNYRRLLDGIAPGSDLSQVDPKSLPWHGSRDPVDTLKFNKGGKAIAIGAHWDDILLGCLGTLLRLQLLHDYTVTVAVLCNTYADRYYDRSQEAARQNSVIYMENLHRDLLLISLCQTLHKSWIAVSVIKRTEWTPESLPWRKHTAIAISSSPHRPMMGMLTTRSLGG